MIVVFVVHTLHIKIHTYVFYFCLLAFWNAAPCYRWSSLLSSAVLLWVVWASVLNFMSSLPEF